MFGVLFIPECLQGNGKIIEDIIAKSILIFRKRSLLANNKSGSKLGLIPEVS